MSELTHVKGLSELQAFLDQLPAKLEANIMRSALRAGAKVVLAQARANVPVQMGLLRDGLRVNSGRISRGVVTVKVQSKGEHAYLARWIEYGTAAHLIKMDDKDRPSRKTRRGVKQYSMKTVNKMIASGSLVIGGRFVGPIVSHPGSAPKPFLRPALDSQSQAALLAVGEAIKKRLTKQGLDASGVDLEAS